jgi:hypothetical protein
MSVKRISLSAVRREMTRHSSKPAAIALLVALTASTACSDAPTAVRPVPRRATVSFVPGGAVFVLTIESVQKSGSVVLVRSQDAEISARATPDADLVVLPGELLIRNGGGTMDVLVSVPPTVTDIRLRIGGVLHPVSLVGGARVPRDPDSVATSTTCPTAPQPLPFPASSHGASDHGSPRWRTITT